MRRLILFGTVLYLLILGAMPVMAYADSFHPPVTETHDQKVYDHVMDVLDQDQADRERNRIDYGESGGNVLFRFYMWLRTGFLKRILWIELAGIVGCFLFWNNKHLVRSIILIGCIGIPVALIVLLFLGGNRF